MAHPVCVTTSKRQRYEVELYGTPCVCDDDQAKRWEEELYGTLCVLEGDLSGCCDCDLLSCNERK